MSRLFLFFLKGILSGLDSQYFNLNKNNIVQDATDSQQQIIWKWKTFCNIDNNIVCGTSWLFQSQLQIYLSKKILTEINFESTHFFAEWVVSMGQGRSFD